MKVPHFSLITLLVAVNVAGVGIWLNLKPSLTQNRKMLSDTEFRDTWEQGYGWPFHYLKYHGHRQQAVPPEFAHIIPEFELDGPDADPEMLHTTSTGSTGAGSTFIPPMALINFFIIALITYGFMKLADTFFARPASETEKAE